MFDKIPPKCPSVIDLDTHLDIVFSVKTHVKNKRNGVQNEFTSLLFNAL